jgi:hypothetical protein
MLALVRHGGSELAVGAEEVTPKTNWTIDPTVRIKFGQ